MVLCPLESLFEISCSRLLSSGFQRWSSSQVHVITIRLFISTFDIMAFHLVCIYDCNDGRWLIMVLAALCARICGGSGSALVGASFSTVFSGRYWHFRGVRDNKGFLYLRKALGSKGWLVQG